MGWSVFSEVSEDFCQRVVWDIVCELCEVVHSWDNAIISSSLSSVESWLIIAYTLIHNTIGEECLTLNS